jgi:hypothetical protein
MGDFDFDVIVVGGGNFKSQDAMTDAELQMYSPQYQGNIKHDPRNRIQKRRIGAAFHWHCAGPHYIMPSSRGNQSDICGMYVTIIRKTSMVNNHGHTAMVSSVIPIFAIPLAT